MEEGLTKKAEDFFRNNIPQKRDSDGYIKHVELVHKYAKFLANKYNADPKVCEIASWLHDVGADAGSIHAEESAKIAKDFLRKELVEPNLINKILSAIRNHSMRQKGGSFNATIPLEDQLVRDADGISFLEGSIQRFLGKQLKDHDKKDALNITIKKVTRMLGKIKTEKAKEIAKPFYDKAMMELEKLK